MLAAARREGVQVLTLHSNRWFRLGPGIKRIQVWAIENKMITSSPNWQRGDHLTRYDIAIHMKIARALGIVVPQSVLLQATEVID